MICPKCGAKISDDSEYCNECGEQIEKRSHEEIMSLVHDINSGKYESSKSKAELSQSNYDISKIVATLSGIIGAILICLSFYFFYCGFNKKDNYISSFTNAYVGGDAYNYIVNGTYFAGYLALGSGLLVSGVVICCTGLIIATRGKKL